MVNRFTEEVQRLMTHERSDFPSRFSFHFKRNFNFVFTNYPSNLLTWGGVKIYSEFLKSNPDQIVRLKKQPLANFLI